jgi:hypothetical protein
MLVNLTPNPEEICKIQIFCKENNFEYLSQNDPKLLLETGIYQCALDHNFSGIEFLETLDRWNYNKDLSWDKHIPEFGVADNVEQIKKYYKSQIEDPVKKWVIAVIPVYQNEKINIKIVVGDGANGVNILVI